MPIIQYTAQLDFTDNGTFETGWRIKQGDYGESEIILRVVNNGVDMYDADITPEIVFRRADGSSVISTMTPNDGTYKYTFVGNELAVPGPTLVDVKYTDSESRISTASCRFTVIEDTIGYDPTGAHTYDNPVSELVKTATAAAETSINSAFIAEGYAKGTQGGEPVGRTSEYYHNNSKFYRDEASALADAFTSKAVETETGSFKSLTGGKLESCVVNFILVQSGSGDPSPSNVRPITGHSSIDVDFYGKNFYDGSDVVKTESDPYVEVTLTHPIPSGSIYYLSAIAENELTTISQLLIEGYDSNGVRRASTSLPNGRGGRTSGPFMPFGSNVVKLRFFGSGYSTTTTNEVTFKDICIEKNGYQDYVYEPFVSKSENYGLGGTYGEGAVDLATGEMSVAKLYVTLNGTESWQLAPQDNTAWFFYYPTGMKSGNVTVPSSHFKSAKNQENSCWGAYSQLHIRPDSSIAPSGQTAEGLAEFKTWLASNNVQVCYELATPQTIQLTPQQIDTLVGMNNIVIPDAGQSLDSVIYRGVFAWDDVEELNAKKADISAIGTEETGATASKAYSVGEHFIRNGKFCTFIQNTAQGATLTLNTNYVEGTIAEAVRYEEGSITPSTGITFSYNQVRRFGKAVNVWIAMETPSNMSSDVILGTIDFIPSTTFGFLNAVKANKPYESVGTVFIRSNKQVVLPQNIPSSTNIYIFGTYICK